MEHLIGYLHDRLYPAPALVWERSDAGVIVSGQYKIVTDRFVQWENDLYIDDEWCYEASSVTRLKQIAANHFRRNGNE